MEKKGRKELVGCLSRDERNCVCFFLKKCRFYSFSGGFRRMYETCHVMWTSEAIMHADFIRFAELVCQYLIYTSDGIHYHKLSFS